MTQTPDQGTLRRAVFAHVQNNPGCTSADVATHFPDKAASAASTLSSLHHDGLLSRQKLGSHYHYIIAEERDAPTPTEAQLAATAKVARRLAEVEAQLAKTRAQLSETEDELAEAEEELEMARGYAVELKKTAQIEQVNTQQQVVTVLAENDALASQIAELKAWAARWTTSRRCRPPSSPCRAPSRARPPIWCDHCGAHMPVNGILSCLRKTCQTKDRVPPDQRRPRQ